jgi:putative membrane protein
MYLIVGMVPLNTPDGLWFIFFCGAVAICTMILPGISGSFVLVVLGKYEYIIDCITRHQVLPLAVFALGCAAGILAFIRILSWLLKHYHNRTMIVLTGLVLGSLRKIWPWKKIVAVAYPGHGHVIPADMINVLPQQWTPEVAGAVAFCVIGFWLAWWLGDDRKAKQPGAAS